MATPLFQRVILNEKELAERVENFGKDWSGDDAVYYKIVMADKAVKREGLLELTQRVVDKLQEDVAVDEVGLLAYHSFRTVSEQRAMKDKDWN